MVAVAVANPHAVLGVLIQMVPVTRYSRGVVAAVFEYTSQLVGNLSARLGDGARALGTEIGGRGAPAPHAHAGAEAAADAAVATESHEFGYLVLS